MGMDPKQERALSEVTASEMERSRGRRRTAAVPDMTVNLESGTPVERLTRAMGAEPVPEMGRAVEREKFADERDKNGDPEDGGSQNGGRDNAAERRAKRAGAEERRSASTPAEDATASEDEAPVKPGEARRTLKARRQHSKGDGNFPRVEPGPGLLDERPEDRQPRDLPKARDDRSAPKGNVTAGQDARNPDLAVRDDLQAPSPQTFPVAPRRVVQSQKAAPKSERRPSGIKANISKRAAPTRAKATRKATRPAGRAKAAATRTPRRATTTRKATKPTARKTARPAKRKPSRPARRAPARSKRRSSSA